MPARRADSGIGRRRLEYHRDNVGKVAHLAPPDHLSGVQHDKRAMTNGSASARRLPEPLKGGGMYPYSGHSPNDLLRPSMFSLHLHSPSNRRPVMRE